MDKKNLAKIKSHSFRGKNYKLAWRKIKKTKAEKANEQVVGLCDSPVEKDKTIVIDPYREDKDFLNTVIHESLHACNFDLAEEMVEETADDITNLLWRLGLRFEQKSCTCACKSRNPRAI